MDLPTLVSRLEENLSAPGTVSENDATLIGKLESIGKSAYLHVLWGGKSRAAVASCEESMGVKFPSAVEDYLTCFNGLILFQGALSVYGIRESFARSAKSRQPFDILERNVHTRPKNAQPGDFFIGSFNWDGSLLFVSEQSPEVIRRPVDQRVELTRWPSIMVMLDHEVSRIGRLFDPAGNQIDDATPTCP